MHDPRNVPLGAGMQTTILPSSVPQQYVVLGPTVYAFNVERHGAVIISTPTTMPVFFCSQPGITPAGVGPPGSKVWLFHLFWGQNRVLVPDKILSMAFDGPQDTTYVLSMWLEDHEPPATSPYGQGGWTP